MSSSCEFKISNASFSKHIPASFRYFVPRSHFYWKLQKKQMFGSLLTHSIVYCVIKKLLIISSNHEMKSRIDFKLAKRIIIADKAKSMLSKDRDTKLKIFCANKTLVNIGSWLLNHEKRKRSWKASLLLAREVQQRVRGIWLTDFCFLTAEVLQAYIKLTFRFDHPWADIF